MQPIKDVESLVRTLINELNAEPTLIKELNAEYFLELSPMLQDIPLNNFHGQIVLLSCNQLMQKVTPLI